MKIALIGTGNVATHLSERLKELSLNLCGVLGSSPEKTKAFSGSYNIPSLENYSELSEFHLAFVCVQDSRLEAVLNEVSKYCNCVTVSGTFDIQQLKTTIFNLGVFYPLQSFSKDAVIDFRKIPFFIESDNKAFEKELIDLAEIIGSQGIIMNSDQRIHLHLTAVFLNNFAHHVSALGNEYATENNIDFHWFESLLEETFRKIAKGASFSDQTGPAQRNDQNTMQKHLDLLDEMKAKVYQTLSDSIQNKKTNQ